MSRNSVATPVSNPSEVTASKQIIVNDLLSEIDGKNFLFFKIGAHAFTMTDVVQTPHGALFLTQPTSDGDGEKVKNLVHDMKSMDGQLLFVEADSEVYEVVSVKDHGNNLECQVNTRPVSFASRRKQVAMFVDNI